LSGRNDSDRQAKTGTDTTLGVGLRLDGSIACDGVLRILGDIRGDVSCDPERDGTVIVGPSGNVAGTIRAPHIIVGGRVCGPMAASRSLEIQAGASVAGDASYRALRIHPGGVLEGSLSRIEAPEDASPGLQDGPGSPATAATRSTAAALRRTALTAILVLLAGIAALTLMNREPAPVAPEQRDASAMAERGAAPTPVVAPPEPARAPGAAGDASAAPPPVAATDPGRGQAVVAPPVEVTEPAREEIIVVRGVNPGKPGGMFSVRGREPAVLLRKTRGAPSPGTRLDVPQGAAASIAFAPNEIFRVEQGRDIEIFYQGRKVGAKAIEGRAWMSFVPQSSASGEKD
jgi:cytoskeletal protein CcmA (bactofilin family)